jgi:hypothetical protein
MSPTRRARRRQITSALLGAFALLLVVGTGIGLLLGRDQGETDMSSGASNTAAKAPQMASGSMGAGGMVSLPGVAVTASGTDYAQLTYAGFSSGQPVHGRTPDSRPGPQTTSAALDRLIAPDALATCLSDVETAVGGTPTSVDFARYQGRPALIVSIPSRRLVVAVGADCGLPGSGADELARS